MKVRVPEIVLGTLLAVAIFSMGMTVQIINPKNNQANSGTDKQAKAESSTSTTDDRLANYTLWLVVFTGVLGASTIGLWWVTWRGSVRQSRDMEASIATAKRSANIAERALTVVERAFCAVSDFSNNTISIRGQLSFFATRIRIANSGSTAAISYIGRVNVVAIENIPDGFRFADRPGGRRSHSVITPRSETYLPADIAIQDAIAAFERRKRILIYGWLEYNDIFENTPRHRTEFCFEIEFFTDPRVPVQILQGQQTIPIFNILPYEQYNGCDDGCHYKPGETPEANSGELPEMTIPPGVTIVQPRT